MMNAGDLPLLAAAIAVAVLMTSAVFLILRMLKIGPIALRLSSALAFPALLLALTLYVEVWNPDPHGWMMIVLGFLAFVNLPFTITTTLILARRFA
ncbi:hypothetical protein [Alteriqipengyuania lutimaris]|uniref:Uncharacterized protein n=1 Tax=Alteriqipengyuania lutimaris TaxID=1538146 RepID=A0A395LIP4_9SPHN|nr:hypothetical protein [Alteriqipengyuania lutimaris]MBB3034305.1 hypothetical protein [Alteriqipengyuania lutimaris]RDS76788.1 hypothetical protein DL238_03635 [Alteriqipengyuania lutimaris]